MSLVVLLVRSFGSFRSIGSNAEARADTTFSLVWIVVVLAANALTAVFIYQTIRGKNWARIGLLLWTVGSWMLWFFYPQRLADHSGWTLLVAGTLYLMELVALILLFRGRGGAWFSSGTGAVR